MSQQGLPEVLTNRVLESCKFMLFEKKMTEEDKNIKNFLSKLVKKKNISKTPEMRKKKQLEMKIHISKSTKILNNNGLNSSRMQLLDNLEPTKNTNRRLKHYDKVFDSVNEEEESSSSQKKRNHVFIKNKYILTNNNVFKKYWSFVIFICIIYSCSISPYTLAFFELDSHNILYLESLIDILFIIDIFVYSFSAYIDKEENVITDHMIIIEKYLKTWFIIDLLSAFPSSLINLFLEDSQFQSIRSILRVSKFYKIYKWMKIIRLLKLNKENDKIDIAIIPKKLLHSLQINRILKFSLLFSIILHISTCLWVYIAKANETENNWIYQANLLDLNNFDLYISSMYFNLVTVLTIGYGDITSSNQYERVYNILYMMVGVALFSFTISTLSTMFSKLDVKALKIKKRFKLLEDITKQFKLPNQLYAKIRKTIKYEIKKTNIEQFEFIDSLPPVIKSEIMLLIHKKHIKESKFFKDQNHEFLIFTLQLLKPLSLSKGEVLFSMGEFVEELYLVTRGVLSLNLGGIYNFTKVAKIKQHNHFGDILLYLRQQSPYELKCIKSNSEVWILKKIDFMQIKMNFNHIILKLLQISLKYLEYLEKQRFAIIEIYKYEKNPKEIHNILKKINYNIEVDNDNLKMKKIKTATTNFQLNMNIVQKEIQIKNQAERLLADNINDNNLKKSKTFREKETKMLSLKILRRSKRTLSQQGNQIDEKAFEKIANKIANKIMIEESIKKLQNIENINYERKFERRAKNRFSTTQHKTNEFKHFYPVKKFSTIIINVQDKLSKEIKIEDKNNVSKNLKTLIHLKNKKFEEKDLQKNVFRLEKLYKKINDLYQINI